MSTSTIWPTPIALWQKGARRGHSIMPCPAKRISGQSLRRSRSLWIAKRRVFRSKGHVKFGVTSSLRRRWL
jgi:hypothetical protein